MNSGYENAANSYGDDQWRKAPHDEYYVGPAARGDAYQETSAADFSNGSARSRPSFFNSKKGDVKPEAYPEPQYSKPSDRSLTFQVDARKREEKGEVKYMPDELKEESLTREVKTHNGKLAEYKVTSGEFENFPEVHPKTIEKLKLRGITSLFPIQYHSFYPIFNREDVIARDLTGSGKTLGFALPVVEFFRKQKVLGQRKIQAIVLAPTRELAIQVLFSNRV